MKIQKPRILIYEGIPGAGKTTLRYAYGKKTGFEDLTIDRFTPSQWVFSNLRQDQLQNRQVDIEKALEDQFNITIIWCSCTVGTAYMRCLAKQDWHESSYEELTAAQNLYEAYFEKNCSFKDVLKIDTTGSIEQACQQIYNHLYKG